MKDYEKFDVRLIDLVEPLKGNLLTLEVDGEEIQARIVDVQPSAARLQVIPMDIKE
jgi:ribosomal protein L25 (general stress protein Ctc)